MRKVQLGLRQTGSGEKILVHANCPLHLPASAQDIAQGDMGVEGFGVNFERLGKRIDGTILAPIEKKIESTVIL